LFKVLMKGGSLRGPVFSVKTAEHLHRISNPILFSH
jgi:hypothetical protein